jgi:type I restriction enzyme S subunit
LINKNLEQQAQAIFKSWFVDFEPFGGNIPSDWKYGTVNDLAQEVVCGKTPSTKIPEYYGGDIPFITIPDMHNNTYTVITERYLSLLGAQSQQKKFLFKNSVCISCIGTAGLVTLVSQKSQTNQQINSIIPKNRYSSYYIYLLMQTLYETINKLGQSGSTIVNLNKTQFEKINVLVPSLESMLIFDQIVQPMFEMILANQLQNIELSTFRDVLLPKLMSGEIDISKVDN